MSKSAQQLNPPCGWKISFHLYNTIFQQTMFDFQRAHNGTPTIPRRIGANVETQSYASCLYMKKKQTPVIMAK